VAVAALTMTVLELAGEVDDAERRASNGIIATAHV